MMRNKRCVSCKKPFYTSDHTVTKCQHCSGTAPDKSAQVKTEAETIRKLNAATTTDKKQIVSIDTLKEGDASKQTVSTRKRKSTKTQTTEVSDAPVS